MEKIINGYTTTTVYDYGDVLSQLSDSYTSALLRIGVGLSIFTLASLVYFQNIETPGLMYYFQTQEADKTMLYTQMLKSGSTIAFILSLFLVVTVMYQKMGWY